MSWSIFKWLGCCEETTVVGSGENIIYVENIVKVTPLKVLEPIISIVNNSLVSAISVINKNPLVVSADYSHTSLKVQSISNPIVTRGSGLSSNSQIKDLENLIIKISKCN